MYRYFEDEIDIVMITDVRHFQKYDYDIINCSLYWTESKVEHLLFVIKQTLNL